MAVAQRAGGRSLDRFLLGVLCTTVMSPHAAADVGESVGESATDADVGAALSEFQRPAIICDLFPANTSAGSPCAYVTFATLAIIKQVFFRYTLWASFPQTKQPQPQPQSQHSCCPCMASWLQVVP